MTTTILAQPTPATSLTDAVMGYGNDSGQMPPYHM
jgi:hypothetical protein